MSTGDLSGLGSGPEAIGRPWPTGNELKWAPCGCRRPDPGRHHRTAVHPGRIALHLSSGQRNAVSNFDRQLKRMRSDKGFIAALDQSGGSTPKALRLYGIAETAWSNEAEMFDLVHQMRTRIITSPAFNGDRVLAAILFERTMDSDIEGRPTADYL